MLALIKICSSCNSSHSYRSYILYTHFVNHVLPLLITCKYTYQLLYLYHMYPQLPSIHYLHSYKHTHTHTHVLSYIHCCETVMWPRKGEQMSLCLPLTPLYSNTTSAAKPSVTPLALCCSSLLSSMHLCRALSLSLQTSLLHVGVRLWGHFFHALLVLAWQYGMLWR